MAMPEAGRTGAVSAASSVADDLPLPPREYLDRVVGPAGSSDGFLSTGRLATRIIGEAVARQGAAIAEFENVLDWGCGCGRVLRFWSGLEGPRFYGADYDHDLVRWCQENLPHATVIGNDLEPPLRFGDAAFDLVYGLSVLTHLDEATQRLWVREIHRVLKPGAYFFFTTVGDADLYLARMDEDELRRFRAGELVVRNVGGQGSNRCAAFAPREWVEANLLDGYELLEHMRHGARCNGVQDGWLVRKSA